MSNIINIILENQNKQKADNETKFEAHLQVINATNIFIENNDKGLISKSTFSQVFNFDREALEAVQGFFELLNSQTRIRTSITSKTDVNGDDYYWIVANGRNGSLEFKLMDFEGLSKLLKAHINKTHIFKVDFAELYNEAISA